MIHAMMMAMLLAGSAPEDHFRFLIAARNPFFSPGNTAGFVSVDVAAPEPGATNQEPGFQPELLAWLEGLKGVAISDKGNSMALIGSDVVIEGSTWFGMTVDSVDLSSIVLKNEMFIVEKVLGAPIEVFPLIAQDEEAASEDRNQDSGE